MLTSAMAMYAVTINYAFTEEVKRVELSSIDVSSIVQEINTQDKSVEMLLIDNGVVDQNKISKIINFLKQKSIDPNMKLSHFKSAGNSFFFEQEPAVKFIPYFNGDIKVLYNDKSIIITRKTSFDELYKNVETLLAKKISWQNFFIEEANAIGTLAFGIILAVLLTLPILTPYFIKKAHRKKCIANLSLKDQKDEAAIHKACDYFQQVTNDSLESCVYSLVNSSRFNTNTAAEYCLKINGDQGIQSCVYTLVNNSRFDTTDAAKFCLRIKSDEKIKSCIYSLVNSSRSEPVAAATFCISSSELNNKDINKNINQDQNTTVNEGSRNLSKEKTTPNEKTIGTGATVKK
jgi:hypothetical protein